jgi:hypothetical protein
MQTICRTIARTWQLLRRKTLQLPTISFAPHIFDYSSAQGCQARFLWERNACFDTHILLLEEALVGMSRNKFFPDAFDENAEIQRLSREQVSLIP